jgi:hypothetical protein
MGEKYSAILTVFLLVTLFAVSAFAIVAAPAKNVR